MSSSAIRDSRVWCQLSREARNAGAEVWALRFEKAASESGNRRIWSLRFDRWSVVLRRLYRRENKELYSKGPGAMHGCARQYSPFH